MGKLSSMHGQVSGVGGNLGAILGSGGMGDTEWWIVLSLVFLYGTADTADAVDMHACMHVCVSERERERERESVCVSVSCWQMTTTTG